MAVPNIANLHSLLQTIRGKKPLTIEQLVELEGQQLHLLAQRGKKGPTFELQGTIYVFDEAPRFAYAGESKLFAYHFEPENQVYKSKNTLSGKFSNPVGLDSVAEEAKVASSCLDRAYVDTAPINRIASVARLDDFVRY